MLYDYNTDDNVATITATSQETDIADEHKRILELLEYELTNICRVH